MRKNFAAKPVLYPMPVMIIGTYDENGNANAMNAAWGGIIGVTFIIVSFLCTYGAEILNEKTNAFPNVNSDRSSVSQNVTFENFKVADESVTFPVAEVNAEEKKNPDTKNEG